jgi:hypothetical protein
MFADFADIKAIPSPPVHLQCPCVWCISGKCGCL